MTLMTSIGGNSSIKINNNQMNKLSISNTYSLNQEQGNNQIALSDAQRRWWSSLFGHADFDLTGQVIWPAAQVLTQYILKGNRGEYTNRKILELGSGVGVCGLFLARLGEKCVLSDNNDVVMDLLQMNVRDSCQRGYECSAVKLDWGNETDMSNVLKEYDDKGFDIIIGSDIVYWQSSIIPLFTTVSRLLSNSDNENNCFILCYQSRSGQTDKFLIQQSEIFGFTHEYIPIDDNSSFIDKNLFTFKETSTLSIISLIKFKRKKTTKTI
eukprot:gene1405-1774_t